MILCHTLGPVEVTLDGGPAPAELLWRKNLALLIYLARSPRRTRSRGAGRSTIGSGTSCTGRRAHPTTW